MTVVTELRVLPALDLTFPSGLPGLQEVRRLRLEPLGASQNVFGRLFSQDAVQLAGHTLERLSLVVAAPGLLWPDYVAEVDDDTATLLELEDPADAAALVVVSVAERLEECTANLFAPVVLNVRKGLAAQVVPTRADREETWPIRAPLPIPAA
ncbi:MAG TPA: flagellar assembly protein FliW [Acidimicrobiales bacterium]|nr:flagellar assembly protein FliW [Acidimicrobiales bacterium]